VDKIERVLEPQETVELTSMAIMLYSIQRVEQQCQALAVYPGMGETWRLTQVISVWQAAFTSAKYLLVAGTEWKKEKSAIRPPIVENLKKPPFWLLRTHNVHAQDHARHTKDQAEWIVQKVQELKIESLALFVSPYHLLRAYLTLLKTFISLKVMPIVIIPVPVSIPPREIIPETGTDAWSMVQGEMVRIKTYQEKGDVATLPELQKYLDWLWEQALLQK